MISHLLPRLQSFTFLTVVLCCRMSQASSDAQNSSSVGRFDPYTRRWISAATGLELPDLIGPFAADVPDPSDGATHGLFFGDSNDRYLVNDYCAKEEPIPPQHEVNALRGCWRNNITLSWQPIVGVHPTGPYYMGVSGTPAERIIHGLQAHLNTFGTPPDFITFSSNLWDLGHWAIAKPALLVGRQIEKTELEHWAEHTSHVMTQIEVW